MEVAIDGDAEPFHSIGARNRRDDGGALSPPKKTRQGDPFPVLVGGGAGFGLWSGGIRLHGFESGSPALVSFIKKAQS